MAAPRRIDPNLAEIRLAEDLERDPNWRDPQRRTRLRATEKMWVDGWDSGTIAKEISKAFGVMVATVHADLSTIRRRHSLADAADRPARAAQARASWNDLKRRAVEARDLRAAAMIQDRLCKMDGLYAPDVKLNLDVNLSANKSIDEVIDQLGERELDALLVVLNALDARQGAILDAACVEAAPVLTTATVTGTQDDDEIDSDGDLEA